MVQRIAWDLPKVQIQVRFLVETLESPASVPDRTADYESARRGSIPRRGAENVLGVCRICTRPCEGRRTRFDSWRGHWMTWRWSQTARRPAAKQFQVGSTPTGASDYPTAWFGLHPFKMTPSEPFASLDGLDEKPNCLPGLHPLNANVSATTSLGLFEK